MYRGQCGNGIGPFALGLLCVIIYGLDLARSDHTTFCINLPGLKYKPRLKSMGMEKFPQDKSIWGHFDEGVKGGAIQYDALHKQRIQMAQYNGVIDAELKLYQIKVARPTEQTLSGWFRVELRLIAPRKDLQTVLKAMLLQVTDGPHQQNIGEFSWQFPADKSRQNCPRNDATKYMVISCGGASKSEPLVSNMIVFVRNNPTLDGHIFPPGVKAENIVPDLTNKHSLNFYVRIPIQDCNQKRYIMFRSRLIFDKNAIGASTDQVRIASLYFRIKSKYDQYTDKRAWIAGGADAIPSPSRLQHVTCNTEITRTGNLPWYAWQPKDEDYGYLHFNNRNFFDQKNDPKIDGATFACQGAYFSGRCPNDFYDHIVQHHRNDVEDKDIRRLNNQNQAKENIIPICQHTPTGNAAGRYIDKSFVYYPPLKFNGDEFSKGFPGTHDYLKTIGNESCNGNGYNEEKTCNISRAVKNRKREANVFDDAAQSINPIARDAKKEDNANNNNTDDGNDDGLWYESFTGNGHDKNKDMYKGIGFSNTGFPRIIWGLRKGHASIMTLLMFFVLPVNLFVTRYYKESFMEKRILYSRVWYQVHVHSTFLIAALLLSGFAIAKIAELFLGTSLTLEAKIHRLLGYVTICLFILLAALGGFRGYDDPLRKITISMHWLLGLIFYFLMVVEVTSAVFIPGSGVTSFDRSTKWKDPNEDETVKSGALFHVIVWIIIEVVMHVIMMGNMVAFDQKMGVEEGRIYLPVPIPVIREHSKLNASGHGVRMLALAVYILLALCSTAWYFISNIISLSDKSGVGLGPMTCTHDPDTLELLRELPDQC